MMKIVTAKKTNKKNDIWTKSFEIQLQSIWKVRPEWVDCITKGPRINSEREGSQIQWNTSNTRQRHQERACVSRTSAEKK